MSANKTKKRILLIEDEIEMVDIITQVLKKEGYDVDVAWDGEEGLNKIKGTKPDMVLLDIMLPKLDGRDLLKKVKQDEEISDIPVVILSAKTEQWDRDIGLQLGADEYIEKPLEVVKLLKEIKKVFDNRQKSSS